MSDEVLVEFRTLADAALKVAPVRLERGSFRAWRTISIAPPVGPREVVFER
jgi:hypothetical protein